MDHVTVPVVGDYMTPEPYLVAPADSVPTAQALMRDHGIRHLCVVDRDQLVGVVSDRDLYLVQSLAHGPPELLTVDDAMSVDVYVTPPDAPLNHVARVMARRKIGSAVVVDHGRVAGVFTVTDALQALVESLEGTATRRGYEGVPAQPPEPRHPSDLR
jgi:acetoin utilization protein AcuB